ncbi:33 kDa chaperonin [Vibrio maritimus]|uniref:33 kDa chaperonin n=1 Tax=Vibrio maritimus TaxID=990268 RepID=A0A090TCX5_9VIBR|nr:33 kDa chaperonin [Vibrio maritimus]
MDILAQDGEVALHCDYCGTTYAFDEPEIKAIFADAQSPSGDNTVH